MAGLNRTAHGSPNQLGVRDLGQGGGLLGKSTVYDEDHIKQRSRTIGYGIDARRQRFPEETPFVYRPFAEAGETYSWDAAAKANLVDYNLLDIGV